MLFGDGLETANEEREPTFDGETTQTIVRESVGRKEGLQPFKVLIADDEPDGTGRKCLDLVNDRERLHERIGLRAFEFAQRQQIGHRGEGRDAFHPRFSRGKVQSQKTTTGGAAGRHPFRVGAPDANQIVEHLGQTPVCLGDQVFAVVGASAPAGQTLGFV